MTDKKKKPRQRQSLTNYYKTKATLEDTFKHAHQMIDEQIRRLEVEMFTEKNVGKYIPHLSKQSQELAKTLHSLGTMYLRIQNEAKKSAELMSFDEQMDAFADWIEFELGPKHQKSIFKRVDEVEFRVLKAERERKQAKRDES